MFLSYNEACDTEYAVSVTPEYECYNKPFEYNLMALAIA